MKLNKLLTLTALAGALATSSAAFADNGTWQRDATTVQTSYVEDIIGSTRVTDGRGEVSFTLTPGQRRDGLQLATDTGGLRILSVSFEYSDGRIVDLGSRDLRGSRNGLLTIQSGRPPGLRVVRVTYALGRRERSATLQLIQLHTGDGYTHENDLWKYHQDEGYFPSDDQDDQVQYTQPAPQPRPHVRVYDHRTRRYGR